MSDRLESVGISENIREFAHGAAQDAISPVADFLAPTLNVSQPVGRYKRYDEKSRFHIPKTLRGMEGRATEIRFDAKDETYRCDFHAIDAPIDAIQQDAADEDALMENAEICAEVAALSHEQRVINAALTATGAGTDVDMADASINIIDYLDQQIIEVSKASKMGSLLSLGILIGPEAYRRFKNHPNVQSKFRAGSSGGKGTRGVQTINPSLDDLSSLLMGNPEIRTTFNVEDVNGPGEDEDIQFLVSDAVIIFLRKVNPTRRDSSFMKTARLRGQWMVPGTYMRDDGRVRVAKMDWSEDVLTTNTKAAKRLNFTNNPGN